MKWESVLVVDDDRAFCALMASHLQRHGYDVESCHSGAEALDVLRTKGPFQVLVTDLVMPGLSGIDLLHRARKLDPDLEVIVITAEGSLETAVAALREGGAYDYLCKPLEMIGDLSLAVGRALTHRRLNYEKEVLRTQVFVEIERLRTLAANVPQGVIITDAAGIVILATPTATRLLACEVQQGMEAFTNLPEPLVALVLRWQHEGAKQPLVTELTLPTSLKVSVTITPVRDIDQHPQGWVMVLQPK